MLSINKLSNFSPSLEQEEVIFKVVVPSLNALTSKKLLFVFPKVIFPMLFVLLFEVKFIIFSFAIFIVALQLTLFAPPIAVTLNVTLKTLNLSYIELLEVVIFTSVSPALVLFIVTFNLVVEGEFNKIVVFLPKAVALKAVTMINSPSLALIFVP